jgi:glycosyltransferase involved in cell wall biosynthesis
MIIGIEAERANNPIKTGVEHYAKQLILHLAEIDKTNQYVLYLRSKPEEWFLSLPKNFRIKVMSFPIFWTQIRISIEMLFHPVDVLFIPASALPLIHPKKSVVTVHDSAFLFYPETFTWFNRNLLNWSYKFIGLEASKIIAVSEATKKDLEDHYKIDGEKIAVVHHGYGGEVRSSFAPSVAKAMAGEKASEGRGARGEGRGGNAEMQLPEEYILFLSTLQPRKNLQGLIEAFKLLKSEYPELPHKLVVVGKPGWKFEKILKLIDENKDIVVYLNHVSEGDKWEILKKASALVMPSFYEGFGMWILEAFEAGTPLAVSRVSSMPEVAADAAVYFDPADTRDIKSAIASILFDRSLSDNLVQKGKVRLQNFSWNKCARETLGVLME